MEMASYPGGPTKAEMDRYKAEEDLRTLAEAARIRKDKGRLAAARKCAKDKMAAVEAKA
jgi:hypothetical protein